MKSFLKCLATGMAVVLVFCIIITTVLLRSGQEVKAIYPASHGKGSKVKRGNDLRTGKGKK